MPEDPMAGKQSERQWREHMAAEERERQLGYDRRKLKEHRAVVALIVAARARYDRARTEAAVVKARSRMPAALRDLRRRITGIDHWGVNSPLLNDYDVLIAALADSYPDAKIAALKGDARALEPLRDDFVQRISKIEAWLKEAETAEEE